MRIRRAAWWSAAVAAALAAGTAAILLSFDIEAYRDEVARAVSEATGRPVSVDGRLSLSLSARPRLVAEDVALGNPPGFSRPEMARIGRLEAQARLWPLLQGRVEIERLVVADADVLLERDASGSGNWLFSTGQTSSSAPPPRIGELVVRDSQLGWLADGRTLALRIDRMEARERDGAVAAELEGAAEGRPISLKGEFSAAPPRSGDAGQVVLARDLALSIGEIEAKGEFTVVLAPERPRLDGSVEVAALDFSQLGPEAPADGRLVPDAPLDPAALEAIDLALGVKVASLTLGGLRFDGLAGRASLENGQLTLSDVTAGLAGGRLSGEAQARRKGEGVAAALRLDLVQAELAELFREGGIAGRIDAKADVMGEGRDLRALAATLSGEARLAGRDGRIEGRALDLAAADLLTKLAPWSEAGADTGVSCLLFASTLRRGRAEVDALVVDADRVLVTGKGSVDLGRERLDLQLSPRPKEPSLFSLATPVNVRGPLANPSITPDEAGLARGAAVAVLGNVVLPGVGLLLPFLSAGAGNHPCAETLSAKPASEAPKPETGEGGLGGLLRGLGRSIDRTLGTGG